MRHTSKPLTDRQIDVIRLIASGLTRKEVGAKLGIGESTVGSHLDHAYEKFGAGCLMELLIAMGWLTIPDADRQ